MIALCLALTLALEDPAPAAAALEWMRRNALVIRTLDPGDEDFSDLEPLKPSLEGVRLVLLGEPSYGDGAAYLAKHRLIRFLHQQLGFDVLAWQAGLFDCSVMEEKLHGDGRTDAAASFGVYAVWGASAEVLPVFEYARSTYGGERPLEMAGFDCMVSARGAEHLAEQALAVFDGEAAGLLTPAQRDAFVTAHRRRFLPPYKPVGSQVAQDQRAIADVAALLARAESPMRSAHGDRRVELLLRAVQDLAVEMQLRVLGPSTEERLQSQILRSRRMAANLQWLAEEHCKGRRIVAWCINQDILRDLPGIDTRNEDFSFAGYETLGDGVHAAFGPAALSVVFTAHRGRAGAVMQPVVELTPAPAGSVEDLCRRTGHAQLFLDLRAAPADHPLAAPLLGRFIGYQPVLATWPRHADAIAFIEVMAESTLRDG